MLVFQEMQNVRNITIEVVLNECEKGQTPANKNVPLKWYFSLLQKTSLEKYSKLLVRLASHRKITKLVVSMLAEQLVAFSSILRDISEGRNCVHFINVSTQLFHHDYTT